MATPRFLYVVRESLRRPEGDEKPVGWRLVGANNRELGRSPGLFGSYEECRTSVARLREHVGAGRGVLTMSDSAVTWTWRLEIDGQAVAVAGRAYHRYRECQYNLTHFLGAVPLAELVSTTAGRPRTRGTGLRAPARPRSTREEPEEGAKGLSRPAARPGSVAKPSQKAAHGMAPAVTAVIPLAAGA